MADETRIERTPVLVVGGGPAGLAAAGIDLETAAGFPGRRLGTLVPGTS